MFKTKVVEKVKTNIFSLITFFFPENLTVYDIMWKIMEEPDRLR